MTLGDYLTLLEYEDPKEKLRQLVAAEFSRESLATVDGITLALQVLGVGSNQEEIWRELGDETGHNYKDLREQVKNLVSRRNDIIHRGDRSRYAPEADEPQPIEYPWTVGHIETLRKVVLASDSLIQRELAALAQTEGGGE